MSGMAYVVAHIQAFKKASNWHSCNNTRMHAQQHTPTHTHTDCFLSLEADYISDIAFAIIRFSGNEVSTADGMVLVCI